MQVYIRLRGASSEFEWQHGQVVRRLETDATTRMAVVQLADGRLVEVNEDQDVLMANTTAAGGAGGAGKLMRLAEVDNLDALTHLHEASFVDYLKERYAIDQVYCRSGSVLIAVNPFKEIRGMYDMAAYNDRLNVSQSGESDDTQLPPHVFSMAESAYRSLRRRRRLASEPKKNQTILVSGESGAGKTESTKFIMQYLAAVSSPSSKHEDSKVPDLTKFLLSANPILESFGNARTLRNDNSSRFGKFVRMFFNEPDAAAPPSAPMQMVRTTVETYLLERVRVVHQGLGERNFHIFYELLKGVSPDLRQSLQLASFEAKDFGYVNVGNCFTRNDGVPDNQQFSRVLEAMNVIGFTAEDQLCIWKILAALLHLGNVVFEPPRGHEDDDPSSAPPCIPAGTSPSKLPASEHLSTAATLLALDEEELMSGLTMRTINVNGETFHVNLSSAQCSDTRDAAARSLYGWIFQYLVKRINDTSPDDRASGDTDVDKRPCIAVLDIFGFEEFDVNQFEQFCINYANEKLQYQFIKDILEAEQDAHMHEGIQWAPVDYQDNAQCLEMIEQKPSGVFSILDEECLMPKGSDASFARKMYLQMKHHSSFGASKKDQVDCAFQVQHYAGQVKYSATGFCEKNKDQPNAELLGMLKKTQDDALRGLLVAFEESETPPPKPQQERSKIRRRASVIGAVGIGSQFKQQLANLLDVVQQTQTHYIRCIKPNDQNTRALFDMGKVSKQLRYGGVLKAVEIMRQSFPVRMPHTDFVGRYRVLLQPRVNGGVDSLVLVKKLKLSGAEVGRTRVFLRQAAFDSLERDRDRLLAASATRIQSKWRGKWQRRQFIRTLFVLTSVQKRWRAIAERKRRMRVRVQAAKRIQSCVRVWQWKRLLTWTHAARRIQRMFKRFRMTKGIVVAASTQSVQAGTAYDTELPSTASTSRGDQQPASSSASERAAASTGKKPLQQAKRPVKPAMQQAHPSTEAVAPVYSSQSQRSTQDDKELLRQALSELERLRHRAAAAEAALVQLAGPQALHTSVTLTVMGTTPSIPMDAFDTTLLHSLVETSTSEAVYQLLTSDPSAVELLNRSENQRGFTPLHCAVRRGCVDILGIFLRPDVLPHVNVNATDRDGNTPLHIAVQLNDELADRVMELLLCFGADANATNYLKQTPLHLCTMVQRDGVQLMEKLLRYGGEPTRVDMLKRTPLHYAVEKGMDAVAILLVQSGGDMNMADAEGQRVVTHPKGTHLLRYLRTTPSWIVDTDITSCMICDEPFSYFFGRKSHCDRCGRVCCAECCPSSANWNGRFCFDCKHYQHVT